MRLAPGVMVMHICTDGPSTGGVPKQQMCDAVTAAVRRDFLAASLN